jgi:hypothetical protein
MLRTAFMGNRNAFNMLLADWLAQRTDLRVVVWSSGDYWSRTWRGRIRFFRRRLKKYSLFKVVDEVLFYSYYRLVLSKREALHSDRMIEAYRREHGVTPNDKPLRALEVADVNAPEVREALLAEEVDAMFADCLNAYVKPATFEAPRLGTFLWHEGFTPEYRGFHSPLYTIMNMELDKLGSTLLKMDRGLDTGPIILQVPVRDVDPLADPHPYIAHKAILDSLPEVEGVLAALGAGRPLPTVNKEGAPSRLYTRPGITDLIKYRRAISQLRKMGRREDTR